MGGHQVKIPVAYPWFFLGLGGLGLWLSLRGGKAPEFVHQSGDYIISEKDYDVLVENLYKAHYDNGAIPPPGTVIPAKLLGDDKDPVVPGETPNFKWGEFRSVDDGPVPPLWRLYSASLARALEVIRASFRKPVEVRNVFRGYKKAMKNPDLIAKRSVPGYGGIGGFHPLAAAADIRVKGENSFTIADRIERLIAEGKIPEGGVGRYHHPDGSPGPTAHYDVRSLVGNPPPNSKFYRSRWNDPV